MNYYFVKTQTRDGEREYVGCYPMAANLDFDQAYALAEKFIAFYSDDWGEWDESLHGFEQITEAEYKVAQKLIGYDISEEYMRDALLGEKD